MHVTIINKYLLTTTTYSITTQAIHTCSGGAYGSLTWSHLAHYYKDKFVLQIMSLLCDCTYVIMLDMHAHVRTLTASQGQLNTLHF